LTTKVVQLINVNELLQSQHGGILAHQKLDCAFVYFLQQFKKAYIGEPSSRVAVSHVV
jgi:exportin-7